MSDTGCQREDDEHINSIDGILKLLDKKRQRAYGNVYIKLNWSSARMNEESRGHMLTSD